MPKTNSISSVIDITEEDKHYIFEENQKIKD